MRALSETRARQLEAAEADGRYAYDMENPSVYCNAIGRYKTERQLSFILESLPRRPARVLDIGGGSGRLAIPVVAAGHAVTVLDPSADALALLRGRVDGRIGARHADLMSFDGGERFDAALAVDTIKYLFSSSLPEVLAKIHGLLEPDGVLIVADINRTSWRNRASVALGRRRQYPFNTASAREHAAALAAAGFELQAMRGFLWMPLSFNSDSRLVVLFERIERRLKLERWISQSPWLLIAARKI